MKTLLKVAIEGTLVGLVFGPTGVAVWVLMYLAFGALVLWAHQ